MNFHWLKLVRTDRCSLRGPRGPKNKKRWLSARHATKSKNWRQYNTPHILKSFLFMSSFDEIVRDWQPFSVSLDSPFKVKKLFENDIRAFESGLILHKWLLTPCQLCRNFWLLPRGKFDWLWFDFALTKHYHLYLFLVQIRSENSE